MKKGNFKGKHAILILLSILAAISLVPVRAEEEYHVVATLEPSNPQGFGGFGGDIALSGDLLLIGEWWGHVEEFGTAGLAYLYDSDWNLLSTLQAPEPELTAEFGSSVDILGDMMVVGSPLYDAEGLRNAGEAYVLDSDGSLLFTLQSPDPQFQGKFGVEVALGKDVILVAETGGKLQGILHAGSVHVFNAEGIYIITLTSSSPKEEAYFGKSLDVSDEFIIVGESGSYKDNRPLEIGSVHVFDYDWNFVTTLQSPEQGERTLFGLSTAISGDTVVICEIWATVEGRERAGRGYIFDTDWNHLATLQAPVPDDNGEFGIDVVVGGDIIVVGERRGDVSSGNEGKAYVFDLEGNLLSSLASPEPTVGAQFGWKVATDGENLVVSEAEATVDGVSKAGRVHVFGPGPGAEPEPVSVPEEAKPVAEEKKPSGGIPGFPYESIILGLVIGAFVLWLIHRRQ